VAKVSKSDEQYLVVCTVVVQNGKCTDLYTSWVYIQYVPIQNGLKCLLADGLIWIEEVKWSYNFWKNLSRIIMPIFGSTKTKGKWLVWMKNVICSFDIWNNAKLIPCSPKRDTKTEWVTTATEKFYRILGHGLHFFNRFNILFIKWK